MPVSAGDSLTIRRKSHRGDPAAGIELLQLLAGGHVPEPQRSIVAAGSQRLAVAGKGECGDHILMAEQLAELLAGCRLPEADDVIGAAQSQQPAVRRKGDRLDI